jgi:hypothetical protein
MSQIETADGGDADADLAAESGSLLAEFVDYIVTRKTVALEELASAFGLRVTDAIDRVRGLEAMGRLTGVMDDRGKFIYVSPEEMKVGGGGEGGEGGGERRREQRGEIS